MPQGRCQSSSLACTRWLVHAIACASLFQWAGAQLPEPKYPLKRQDLIAAMPADDNHRALVFASRHWRKVMHCPCLPALWSAHRSHHGRPQEIGHLRCRPCPHATCSSVQRKAGQSISTAPGQNPELGGCASSHAGQGLLEQDPDIDLPFSPVHPTSLA